MTKNRTNFLCLAKVKMCRGRNVMIPIKDYVSIIYKDFNDYVEKNNNLCMLKTLTYEAGQKPDYSDIHIQQLYLLRYAYSYAFEYKSMYVDLFAREQFKDSILVSSIGCGSMIDYWGLVEALKEINNRNCQVKYKGIDTIEWNYPIKKREKDTVDFIKINASTVFKKANKLISNVYIFPKSISEFSTNQFEDICEVFSEKEIEKDKVHILISLRSDERSMDRDMDRSEKLILAMKQNGFVTNDQARTYIYFKEEEKGIKGLDYKFDYPDDAIELLKSLSEKCSSYINNFENCFNDCKKYLNRWPVMKARNIRYQVLSFNRKDSL